jgi:hypothetical protein
MLLASIGIGWVAVKIRQARRQRAAVEAIEELGGSVKYDYMLDEYRYPLPDPQPPEPAWLGNLLGDDLFAGIASVNGCNTKVTDAGLEHLKRFDYLIELWLQNTTVTDAGVKKLQQALPHCHIVH